MTNEKRLTIIRICGHISTAIFFVLSCLFMYGFYKSLSGFIANKFEEPLVMLPIISSYLLPVICFLFYFYDLYVAKIGKVVRWVYVVGVCLWAVVNLVGIFANFPLYKSNHALGVYDTIPSLLFGFPYDGLISHFVLLLAQLVGVACLTGKGKKVEKVKGDLRLEKGLQVKVWEYVLLCIIAIFAFVFIGSAICATAAWENVFYDGKFIYLFLWVLLLPITDLAILLCKPKKVWILAAAIGLNVLFDGLLWIFEVASPGFIIHIGKPFFVITFSVSIPIEPIVLLAISFAAIATLTFRLVRLLVAKKKA